MIYLYVSIEMGSFRNAERQGTDMRMYDLIMKKRNGGALSDEEISFMIKNYTNGEIPDYQVSAMMMAIYFQGDESGGNAGSYYGDGT